MKKILITLFITLLISSCWEENIDNTKYYETSNVITYSVMVNVNNDELLLKPGMTANVEILVGNKDNILRIPTKALYFKVPDDLKGDEKNAHATQATDSLPIWLLEGRKPVKDGSNWDFQWYVHWSKNKQYQGRAENYYWPGWIR